MPVPNSYTGGDEKGVFYEIIMFPPEVDEAETMGIKAEI